MTNKPRRSPTLKEYMEQDADDSNAFWRLESGDRQNLLDEAIEEILQLREAVRLAKVMRNNVKGDEYDSLYDYGLDMAANAFDAHCEKMEDIENET